MIKLKDILNEGLYYVGYNKGRGQGTGVFKDSYSSYKDAKKAVEKLEKERGGSYNQIAYYVSDKDGKFVINATYPCLNMAISRVHRHHPYIQDSYVIPHRIQRAQGSINISFVGKNGHFNGSF